MLTYQDCVSLTGLEEEEIAGIGQHEHVPEMIAAELGCCLVHDPHGIVMIRQFLCEDIENAQRLNHPTEALHWQQVLEHFSANHSVFDCQAA